MPSRGNSYYILGLRESYLSTAIKSDGSTYLSVTEAKTGNPVYMASLYIVPANDTIATAFSFTDKYGQALLKTFPAGEYTVNVQMLGFKSYDYRNDDKRTKSHRISYLSSGETMETDREQTNNVINNSVKSRFGFHTPMFESAVTRGFSVSGSLDFNSKLYSNDNHSSVYKFSDRYFIQFRHLEKPV